MSSARCLTFVSTFHSQRIACAGGLPSMWRRCSWTLDAKYGVDMLEHHRLMPRWARLIYIANDPGRPSSGGVSLLVRTRFGHPWRSSVDSTGGATVKPGGAEACSTSRSRRPRSSSRPVPMRVLGPVMLTATGRPVDRRSATPTQQMDTGTVAVGDSAIEHPGRVAPTPAGSG